MMHLFNRVNKQFHFYIEDTGEFGRLVFLISVYYFKVKRPRLLNLRNSRKNKIK